MLHLETLEPGALAILKRLMAVPALQDYSLVGRTALALRYGHRLSVDLDLFSERKMDHAKVLKGLSKEFGGDFEYKPSKATWAVFCRVAGVKVDVVRYPHTRIAEVVEIDGIRLYDDVDIAPMKLQAILGRGKKKDFWDLHELLKAHGLQWIMDKHAIKYPNHMLAISIPHAITYFVDAEYSDDPVSLKGQTWDAIKASISKTVSDYLK